MKTLITEKDWQATVIAQAKVLGYEFIYFTWNSRHSPAGFPDLIILRDGRMIVAELKREGEQPTPEQYFWLLEFLKVTKDVYLWYPSDWDEVVKVLNRY